MTAALTRQEYAAIASAPKRNKYGAKKTIVDGVQYDSAGEAAYFEGLRVLEKQGLIYELERQKPYILQAPNGQVIGVYRADAAFYDAEIKRYRVQDFKGVDTALSKWKRKHVEAQYGIPVEIVRK